MNGKILMSVAAASLLLLTFSCSRTETDPEPLDGPVPIRFKVASADADVKGTGVMTTEKLNDFGLFAVHVPVGSDRTDLSHGYMMNVKYEKDAAKGWYDTNPPRYWPVAGNLTFFALTPYDPSILTTVDIGAMMSRDYPTLEWGPSENPAEQVDICVAVNSNQPRQLEVPLEFHHGTSQIYFAANYIEVEEGEYIVIDTVILHNLIGKKNVTIVKDIPYVEWEPDGTLPRTQDYLLYRKDGDPNSTLNNVQLVMRSDYPDGVEITNDKGTLFLVPQTYFAETKNVEITVKYTLWQLDELIQPDPFVRRHTTMEGILPPCTWEPDTRYRYILTLNDKTNVLAVNLHVDYKVQPAKFYAMTNVMSLPEASAVVGSTTFELVATVGPVSLDGDRKKVEWEVENYLSESNKTENEFIRLSSNTYDAAAGTNKVTITCKKVTTDPVKITARTVIAENDDDKLESYCMFSVTPAGVGLSPLTMDPEYTGW